MTLARGMLFNFYQIGESIGIGGMGEVYRATDTKLKRDVALKVLPSDFANDAERLARFQREAELLASLNHPNIAQIFGLEQANGITALIMELIEGPTLAERIEQGPLPPDDALTIALQIAEALEAAHERGIVHRDLKPANIKLKSDGRVKVLDFGIAKSVDPALHRSGPVSPHLTTPAMTQSGMILGTAAYMSPEQARGKAVDRRTDIWAFGCLLYEMLTGQPAFGGEDVQETLARVITNASDMRALPVNVPPALKQAIELCLEKDPQRRLADIRDVRLVLKGRFAMALPSGTAPPVLHARWWRTASHAVAVIAGGIVVGLTLWIALQPQPQPVNRFAYVLPDDQVPSNSGGHVLTFSPDGRRFAYTTAEGIYVRELGELEARLIPGTGDDVAHPFFAPDGQSLAYISFDTRQLKRIPLIGGAAVVIADFPGGPFGAHWASEDMIVISDRDSIMRVSVNGGSTEVLLAAQDGENLGSPELLPDGNTLLYTSIAGSGGETSVVAQRLGSPERFMLIQGGKHAHYLPSGHMVYAIGSDLYAMAFDADALTVSGASIPLVQGVLQGSVTSASNFGVSTNGTLVYLHDYNNQLLTPVWVDRQGKETELPIEPGFYTTPRLSPNGNRVVLNDRAPGNAIWIWDLAGETRSRLNLNGTRANYPIWSADGTRIAYSTPAVSIDWKPANNSGTIDNLATRELLGQAVADRVSPYFFTASDQELVFGHFAVANADIGLFKMGDDADAVWLLREPYSERNAVLSPDGRWMAYESDESGTFEIYVRPFPNVNDDQTQVSNAGGQHALWSRAGDELFFLEPNDTFGTRLTAVPITTDAPVFTFGARTPLLDWPYFSRNSDRTYDVAPDGQRFVALKDVVDTAQGAAAREVIVVENWLQEFERQVSQ